MFDSLSDKLDGVFKKLRGLGKISEANVTDALREVRMALLEADVDFNVAKLFINTVKEKSLGIEVMQSVTPGQQIIKIFHDELTHLLGGDEAPLELNPPGYILMVGLNGAGKTTTSAKLALKLKKEGRRPLLVACDLYRPAAVEQLATLAGEVGVPVYKPAPGEQNLLKVAKDALKWAETQNGSVIIFDTAGRQEVDEALIAELKDLRDYLKPREILLVADAATGQQAVNVAAAFNDVLGITGIVLTRLDGDARGGAALSMRSVTQKPIKFAGMGEKLEMLDTFHPDRMAQRILGMGDVISLVEKAAEAIDEKQAMRSIERLTSGDFDFEDYLDQMKMMKKLTEGSGGLMGLLGFLPGVGKQIKEMKNALKGGEAENKMKRTEAMVLSMTKQERKRPEILNAKRRARIAAGSGNTLAELNAFLKQFTQMRGMMKDKGKMGAMMAAFEKMGGGGMPGMGGAGGMPDMSKLMGGGGGMPDMSKLMGGAGGGMPDFSKLLGGGGGSGGSGSTKPPQPPGGFNFPFGKKRR